MLCLECDRDGAKAEAADLCGICFVEGLSEAPCAAVLPCKHVFHVECLADLLRARWSGPRISFGFLSCPNMACRGPFDSRCAALEPALAALRALRREVEGMALKRIEMEGLWPPKADSSGRDEKVLKAVAAATAAAVREGGGGGGSSSSSGGGGGGGGGGGDAGATAALDALKLDFAMSRLSYYLCEKAGCGRPFFAGLASCEGLKPVGGGGGGAGGGGASSSSPAGGGGGSGGARPPHPPPPPPAHCPRCREPPPGATCTLHGYDQELVLWKCSASPFPRPRVPAAFFPLLPHPNPPSPPPPDSQCGAARSPRTCAGLA